MWYKLILLLRKKYVLIIILFLALLLRIIGLFPGYAVTHPDEPMSYDGATNMIINHDLNPRRFDYPAGVPILHVIVYAFLILPVVLGKQFLLHPHLFPAYYLDKTTFFKNFTVEIFGVGFMNSLFWSRYITGVLGTLLVFLTYKTGKKLFNKAAGLAASFFLAVNYREVFSSHFAVSDIPNSFFALLAFFCTLILREKPTRKWYLLSGITAGISFSIKYQPLAFFPLFSVLIFFFFKKKGKTDGVKKNILLALLAIVVTFLVLNPYLILNIKTAIPVIKYVSLRYGAGTNRFNFYPLYYLYLWGIGKYVCLFIFLSFVACFLKERLKTLLLLTFIVPFLYTFLFYMSGGTYVRNFTTIIPFFMLFAGFGASFLIETLKKLIPIKYAVLLCIIVLLAVNKDPIVNSIILSKNYTQTRNRERMSQWVSDNIPKKTTIINANEGFSPNDQLQWNIIPWDHSKENSISEITSEENDFAVLNLEWYQVQLFWFNTPSDKLHPDEGIPYSMLKNTYYPLALEEFKNYSVQEFYKSWQSPEENYIVLKLPLPLVDKGKQIAQYSFEKDTQNWTYINEDTKQKSFAQISKPQGEETTKNLIFSKVEKNFETDSLVSPFIPVREGAIYSVDGFVKPEKAIVKAKRDGFFMIDFYSSNKVLPIPQNSITHALSPRIYGESVWMDENVFLKAPKKAKFLTVRFQRSVPSENNRYCINKISVFENTNPIPERYSTIHYIKPTVPDDVVFPNSIL